MYPLTPPYTMYLNFTIKFGLNDPHLLYVAYNVYTGIIHSYTIIKYEFNCRVIHYRLFHKLNVQPERNFVTYVEN